MRILLFLLAGLMLAGCGQQEMLVKFSTKEERDIGVQTVAAIQTGDIASVKVKDSKLRVKLEALFPKMTAAVPNGAASKTKLVDAGFNEIYANGQKTRQVYLAYEVSKPQSQALVRIGLVDQGSGVEITDLYVDPLKQPVSEMNRFTLEGKTPLHYVVLFASIGAVALTVWALWALFRTRGIRRKWLWAIGIIVGFGQIGINWTSGELAIQLIRVQLFSASAIKPGFIAPWIVGFSIPLFAILFLLKRRSLQAHADTPADQGI